jgi:hypothetical protein
MWKNRLISSIISIIATLAFAAAIIAIALFGVKIVQDLDKNTDKERQNIETEYEELHEDNFDEETGKKILTEKFLEKEYRSYYIGEKANNRKNSSVMVIFVLGAIGLYLAVSIFMLLSDLAHKRKTKISSIVIPILLVPLVFIGTHYLNKLSGRRLPPDPDSVTFTTSSYNFLYSEMRTKVAGIDEEEDETFYYLMYANDGKLEALSVNSRVYGAFTDPGMYYLVQAESNGKKIDLMIYPMSEYEEQK